MKKAPGFISRLTPTRDVEPVYGRRRAWPQALLNRTGNIEIALHSRSRRRFLRQLVRSLIDRIQHAVENAAQGFDL